MASRVIRLHTHTCIRTDKLWRACVCDGKLRGIRGGREFASSLVCAVAVEWLVPEETWTTAADTATAAAGMDFGFDLGAVAVRARRRCASLRPRTPKV